MRPLRHQVFGPGRRTPATMLLIDERDKLLIEAAKFFPGCSDREIARRLHAALSRYRGGRWRRDRAEALCPVQHRGKLVQTMWCLLKVSDMCHRRDNPPRTGYSWPMSRVSLDHRRDDWRAAMAEPKVSRRQQLKQSADRRHCRLPVFNSGLPSTRSSFCRERAAEKLRLLRNAAPTRTRSFRRSKKFTKRACRRSQPRRH